MSGRPMVPMSLQPPPRKPERLASDVLAPEWGSRSVEIFHKIEQVGEGTYGQVYKGKNKETNEIVALKKVRMDNEKEGFPITAIREIKILKLLNHQNIVRLKEIVTSKATDFNRSRGSIYMVFEYLDHDLTGLIDSGVKLTMPEIKCYMKQLLEGLFYCHTNKILHRDIKGSNLLIDNKGNLKLADFGLARPMKDGKYTNRVITLWYRPPEVLLGAETYGPKIDIWSCGVILAELLMGKPILPGRVEVDQMQLIFKLCGTPDETQWPGVTKLKFWDMLKPNKVYKNEIRTRFASFPKEALDLVASMLVMNPKDRISAADALDSDFFWTKPLPCKPEEVRKWGQANHEFQTKQRRRAAEKEKKHPNQGWQHHQPAQKRARKENYMGGSDRRPPEGSSSHHHHHGQHGSRGGSSSNAHGPPPPGHSSSSGHMNHHHHRHPGHPHPSGHSHGQGSSSSMSGHHGPPPGHPL